MGIVNRRERVGDLAKAAIRLWGRSSPRRFLFFLKNVLRLWQAERKRALSQRSIEGSVPMVIAVSPTMKCNYNCIGCYSRGRPTDRELQTNELDSLFTEAEEIGVLAVVVTGGEPLLQNGLLNLMKAHRRLLFVLITNGSLFTQQKAINIARSGNVVTLISIEGLTEHTDIRRGHGAHENALQAFKLLQQAHACYGFATTVTSVNASHIVSDDFIDDMISLGCSVGYLVEYVPCGETLRPEWIMGKAAHASFRDRILEMRNRKPIVLIHFPDDEYGPDNRCSAAGTVSLHINSQGDVEPCPFVSISCDNIRNGGLRAACRSAFLRRIRENPDLLRRQEYACALYEHREQIEELAAQCRDN
jgi:MoaA/NifB/PqqE/SkfB family radical SAM enzyme